MPLAVAGEMVGGDTRERTKIVLPEEPVPNSQTRSTVPGLGPGTGIHARILPDARKKAKVSGMPQSADFLGGRGRDKEESAQLTPHPTSPNHVGIQ